MKKYRLKLLALSTILLLASVSACKKPQAPVTPDQTVSQSGHSGEETQPQTDAPTEAPTETETEPPRTYLENADYSTEKVTDCLTRIQSRAFNAMYEGKYIEYQEEYLLKGNHYIYFVLKEKDPTTEEGGYEPEGKNPTYLGVWDEQDHSFSRVTELEPYEGEFGYITVIPGEHYIWTVTHSDKEPGDRFCGYDEKLNLIRSFTAENNNGCFAKNDEWFMLRGDKGLKILNTDGSGLVQPAKLDESYYPISADGCIRNANGKTLYVLNGYMNDMKEHQSLVDLDTNQIVKVFEDTENTGMTWSTMNGGFQCSDYTSKNTYYYYQYGDLAYKLTLRNSADYGTAAVGKYLVINRTRRKENANGIQIIVFDMEKGEYVADELLPLTTGNVFLERVLSDEDDHLTLHVQDFKHEVNEVYTMNLAAAGTTDPENLPPAELYERPVVDLAGIDIVRDLSLYQTGPCRPEMVECRQFADRLEEEYGIKIYVSDEAQAIVSNYAILADNDKDEIMLVLEDLEKQLKKYPKDFFRQMTWNRIDHIAVYLGGEIAGFGSNALGIAGGFQIEGNEEDIIYLNCLGSTEVPSFNHEVTHAIDRKLASLYGKPGFLDDDEWGQLNPENFEYGYSYSDWEIGSMKDEFRYTGSEEKPKNVYFVDSYAKTYPTEDRARIMEHAMMEESWFEISEYPKLVRKLRFYSKLIREGFDTTGWDDTLYWERKLPKEDA